MDSLQVIEFSASAWIRSQYVSISFSFFSLNLHALIWSFGIAEHFLLAKRLALDNGGDDRRH